MSASRHRAFSGLVASPCSRTRCSVQQGGAGARSQARRSVARAAAEASRIVVGVGGAGVDYLASVGTFPQPDSKIRTEALAKQGGGNCGNACTGLARLGANVRILSAIGDDVPGDHIMDEFAGDGVDTTFLHREKGADSPFTYIIVDQLGGTRTCIHTPGATLHPEQVTPELCEDLLRDASLVFCDGRLTESALVVAKAARERGLPLLVEAERIRYNLDLLLAQADYVVTSGDYPGSWTGEESRGDAILATALRLPQAKWMVTTFGKAGSMLIERRDRSEVGDAEPATLDAVIDDMMGQLKSKDRPTEEPACQGAGGVQVRPGQVVSTGAPVLLRLDRSARREAVALEKALKKTRQIAGDIGADLDDASADSCSDDESPPELQEMAAVVYACSAASIPEAAIVDTTGAGDAYIASLIYGLTHGKSIEHMLRLGSVVSACKCTQLGARPGLPQGKDLSEGWL